MKKVETVSARDIVNGICEVIQLMGTPVEIFEYATSKTCGSLIDMYCKKGTKVVCINDSDFDVTFEMFKVGEDNTLVNCVELSFDASVIHELEQNIVAMITSWANNC